MATKFQYNEEAHNSNMATYGDQWSAQTFQHDADVNITSVELKLHRSGSGGNAVVHIRNTADGKPSGGDLVASDPVDCSGITTNTTGEWVTFTLSSTELTANTKYAICLSSDGDVSNTVRLETDTSSPSYANGNSVTSTDAGSGWTTRAWDFIFRAWGTLAGGGIMTPHFYNRLLAGNS